jgi:hypothetical protein
MSRGSPEVVSRLVRVDDGSLEPDPKRVPLADGLVVAGEGIGPRATREHSRFRRFRSREALVNRVINLVNGRGLPGGAGEKSPG